MTTSRFLSKSPPRVSASRLGSVPTVPLLWVMERRIASAERELRIQFTRIAQLQAELDVLLATLRRPPVGAHKR
jgi:hypothetical protein